VNKLCGECVDVSMEMSMVGLRLKKEEKGKNKYEVFEFCQKTHSLSFIGIIQFAKYLKISPLFSHGS